MESIQNGKALSMLFKMLPEKMKVNTDTQEIYEFIKEFAKIMNVKLLSPPSVNFMNIVENHPALESYKLRTGDIISVSAAFCTEDLPNSRVKKAVTFEIRPDISDNTLIKSVQEATIAGASEVKVNNLLMAPRYKIEYVLAQNEICPIDNICGYLLNDCTKIIPNTKFLSPFIKKRMIGHEKEKFQNDQIAYVNVFATNLDKIVSAVPFDGVGAYMFSYNKNIDSRQLKRKYEKKIVKEINYNYKDGIFTTLELMNLLNPADTKISDETHKLRKKRMLNSIGKISKLGILTPYYCLIVREKLDPLMENQAIETVVAQHGESVLLKDGQSINLTY